MIKGIVYRIFQAYSRQQAPGFPTMSRIHSRWQVLFPGVSVFVPPVEVLCRDVPYRKDGYRMQLLFSGREQETVFCSSLRRFCKFLFRINVQKFQLFADVLLGLLQMNLRLQWARQQTRTTFFNPAVCTIPITLEHPSETMEKFYRIIPAPSGSVIIQDDRWFSISPAQVIHI